MKEGWRRQGQRFTCNVTTKWCDHLNWDKLSNYSQRDLNSFKNPGGCSCKGLNPWPPAQQTGALPTEVAGRPGLPCLNCPLNYLELLLSTDLLVYLIIKRKIGYIQFARRFVNSRKESWDFSIRGYRQTVVRLLVDIIVILCTRRKQATELTTLKKIY